MSTIQNSPIPGRSHGIATLPVIATCCGLSVVSLGLWVAERNQVHTLEQERAQTASALDQAKVRIQQLSDRLNTLDQQKAALQPPAVQKAEPDDSTVTVHTAPHAAPPRPVATKRKAAVRVASSDPRLDRLQGQLTEARKELASTRDELAKDKLELDGKISSTRDDLSGSIAKNHDEVIALQKRGERSIHEFKLTKSKEMQRVGPVSISLRSTSTRHKTYDLAMMVDDNSLSKKHVNLYEPVWITLGDRPQPVELVVNRIGKNDIEGYVSEPRYRNSELAANAEQPPKAPQQLATRDQGEGKD